MKFNRFSVFIAIVASIVPCFLCAQNLPSLPVDPAISVSSFPNGMSCYVVNNPDSGNSVDYLLVQKSHQSVGRDSLVVLDGSLLKGSKLIPDIQHFMLRNSIGYGKEGYITRTPSANIYAFRNVASSESLQDSVLLALFDIAGRSSWISPSDQAIIVSGRVNSDVIKNKAKQMSYMLIEQGKRYEKAEYKWLQSDSAKFVYAPAKIGEDLCNVTISYTSPRLSDKNLATVLPLVSGQLNRELAHIVKARVIRNLYSENIPSASVDVNLVESTSTTSDEVFSVTVLASPDRMEDVCRIIVSTLADLDSGVVNEQEYLNAHKICIFDGSSRIRQGCSNCQYSEKCVNAFLYGASLASDAAQISFIGKKEFDTYDRLLYFNNYARNLIDKDTNVTVSTTSCVDLSTSYSQAWTNHRIDSSAVITGWDDSFLAAKSTRRALPLLGREPVSDGRLWRFPGGVRVAYAQKPTGGRIYYKVVMNGGLSSMPSIPRGAGAFFDDLFFTGRFNGVEGSRFKAILKANGISVKPSTGVSRFVLSGSAPSDKAEMLISSFITMTRDRANDSNAANYYMECERMRLGSRQESKAIRLAAIDSLLFPSNRYTLYKSVSALNDGLSEVASRFYKQHFDKLNDGVIVLVGDIETAQMYKILRDYVSEMSVSKNIPDIARPSSRFIPEDVIHTVSGDYPSMDYVMSIPMHFSSSSYAAFNIALMALQDKINLALEGTGMYADVRGRFFLAPQERGAVAISVEEVNHGGLIENIASPVEEVSSKVHEVISGLTSEIISDSDLKRYANQLIDRDKEERKRPEYWLEAISLRHCNNKDITSDFSSSVKAINAENIRVMISNLHKGGKIEYIVKN